MGSFATFQTDIGEMNIADYVGAWGVDTANHDVWSVIDHNSQFAVVPEPSSLALIALGLLGLAIYWRKAILPRRAEARLTRNRL